MNNLTIKPSLIEGKGVFADSSFKKGEIVMTWEPCHISLSEEEQKKLPLGERKFVKSGILLVSPSRFLNHSCLPNTTFIDGKNVALQNIPQGEEITIDYHKEDIPHLGMRCNCGSKRCRGIIPSTIIFNGVK